MSKSEHQHAINAALATSDKLLDLFGALGSKQDQMRGLWAAFGLARRNLYGKLDDTRHVNRTLAQLRETARAMLEKQILAAARAGEKQAAREIAIYDELPKVDVDTDAYIESAASVMDAEIDRMLAQVRAASMTGGDEALILGDGGMSSDDGRMGLLRASALLGVATAWIAQTALLAYNATIEASVEQSRNAARSEWMKQAIAALDGRTTDCCLQVSGQTVPLKAKFRLTGEPRYADEMDNPPFHRYCRTATALVRAADAGDDLTRDMQQKAAAELNARAGKDKRGYDKFINAFSGRAGEL